MKIKQHTVNVIEMVDGSPIGLRAFTDCRQGNKRAEKLFRVLIKEHEETSFKSTKEDIEYFIEDGTYERGHYRLLLVHST